MAASADKKQANKQPANKKSLLRRFGRGSLFLSGAFLRQTIGWMLTVAVILLLGLAVFLMYLKTGRGMVWLGQTVSQIASTDDMKIDVTFAEVSLTRVRVPAVTLSDRKGIFLEAEEIDLAINKAAYALLRPVVDHLLIKRVDLHRLPETPAAKAAPAEQSAGGMPRLMFDIHAFNIDEIRTGPAVYGDEQFFNLKSRIILSPRLADNDIDILLAAAAGRGSKATTHMHLRIGMTEAEDLRIDMAVRDAAGGMLTRLAGLPGGYDIDATLQGEGPPRDWQGIAQLRLGRELSGHFALLLKNNSRLRLDVDLKGPRKVDVKGFVDIPMQLSPPMLPMREQISGTLNSTLDLRSATLLLGLDDHRLTGTTKIQVNLSGPLQQPAAEGTATLRDATYENLMAGVKLSAIRADVVATRTALRITGLSARTPGGGSMKGEADAAIQNLSNPTFNFAIDFTRAQLLGMENAQVQATGRLKGSGDKNFANVEGDITVNKAEIYLAGFGSSSAANMLNITEVNVPQKLRRDRRRFAVPQSAYRANLDIRVDAPRAIFVRGQGLESEWSAKAHVRGTSNEPQVDGVLKMLRGKYEFFDALMTFTTGVVDFTAGNMTNPDLDIKGNIKGKQVTANVAVGGTAQAPEVTLTSTPALPQDEILSRVFFDKSVTELTPMEMVRIAQIIGVMTGKIGGGMDPISQLRKKAGIDMLSVNRDDKTGDTSVSVGKYLSDGVYMSVDQGVNTQGSAVKLQIELRPNLQVETRVGNDNNNSVGVNWKKDY